MRTVLIANPSADIYGSDLQMLDSVTAMRNRGWRVVVAIPENGPLASRLHDREAEIKYVDAPVVRRSDLSLKGMARLVQTTPGAIRRLRSVINEVRADLVYVNTLTIPWWLAAGRYARVPVVCHVHEAEDKDGRLVLTALNAPLAQATCVIANGAAASDAIKRAVPWLERRIRVIHNGVAGPDYVPNPPRPRPRAASLVVVGRLSPRKAPEVALEAVSKLRTLGYDVTLEICGTPFAGYEWYEQQLLDRARVADLRDHVTFSGYVSPIWPALERADMVVATSLGESFGNAVVEGQLAARPVIATAVTGHVDTVANRETGMLVPLSDPEALAQAVALLIDSPDLALKLAVDGRRSATNRFSIDRYRSEIVELLSELLPPQT